MLFWRYLCLTSLLFMMAFLRVISKDCCDRCWADCEAYLDAGHTTSGVYHVYPEGMRTGYDVYCDMTTDGGGWTVFQRRIDGSVNFYKDWASYVKGFGNASHEYWLGLHALRRILSQGYYELRIDIEDWAGETAYATYKVFEIGPSADNFRLTVEMYEGTAGDSLGQQNGQMFSTMDRDNDVSSTRSCAVDYRSGWWFKGCSFSNLNGVHEDIRDGFYYVVVWYHWKNEYHSLKRVDMKIRRA